jgi:hypothetical protein
MSPREQAGDLQRLESCQSYGRCKGLPSMAWTPLIPMTSSHYLYHMSVGADRSQLSRRFTASATLQ